MLSVSAVYAGYNV
uniref:Uncharacterized protein n=1 Tax=Anguilla anguilla TaxID=7936 RepID=A0A0E9V1F5_ANGAN